MTVASAPSQFAVVRALWKRAPIWRFALMTALLASFVFALSTRGADGHADGEELSGHLYSARFSHCRFEIYACCPGKVGTCCPGAPSCAAKCHRLDGHRGQSNCG